MKPTSIHSHEGKKYLRRIFPAEGYGKNAGVGGSIFVDVYCVIEAFGVTCPARQHALKKLLCAGLRDKGDTLKDLKETLGALSRAIEMEEVRTKMHEEGLSVMVHPVWVPVNAEDFEKKTKGIMISDAIAPGRE